MELADTALSSSFIPPFSSSSSNPVPTPKDFRKKGLDHYELLGWLFNMSMTTGFLQISSAQPAPNRDEERELDAAFLTQGVHVSVELDSPDDVNQLPPRYGAMQQPKRKEASSLRHLNREEEESRVP